MECRGAMVDTYVDFCCGISRNQSFVSSALVVCGDGP